MERRIPPGPGQESVWDYPRPPRVEPAEKLIQVRIGGVLLAESRRALRVLETGLPPVYYLPPQDVRMESLRPSRRRRTFCTYKGWAHYYDAVLGDRHAEVVGWAYAEPTPPFAVLRDHVAFYASAAACYVDGER
ncbi:MAG: DUF427 domain-containing protein, partial [Acidobacteria bacterium]